MLFTAAEMPASGGAFEAVRPALAIGLPESPAAAVALLLVLLAISYALLTVFIKVGVPAPGPPPDEDEDGSEGPPDPDWPSETVPDYPEPYGEDRARDEPLEEPEYAREPLAIESVRVRDALLALGDPASRVMAAFRPGEGETVPMVQRDAGGRASYVSRTYRVGRRVLTLVMERDSPTEPLSLVRIEVGP